MAAVAVLDRAGVATRHRASGRCLAIGIPPRRRCVRRSGRRFWSAPATAMSRARPAWWCELPSRTPGDLIAVTIAASAAAPAPRRSRDQLHLDARRLSVRSRCWCRGRACPNGQWSLPRWRPMVTGLPGVVAPCGQVKDDFSAPRLRQSPHPAPAGGARRHRGPPSAPRLVRATRDRTPAPPGSAERHAALAPAPATDRRRAGDGAEARGMDALALAIGPSRVADSSTRGGQARVLNRPHGPPRRAP